jgi:osmotically-inducible protein OsmY
MKQKLTSLLGAFAVAALTIGCSETDAGLTTKVKSKMMADDTVKAYQIDVDTSDKVVTLTGTVDSMAAKEQALALTRETEGVMSVVDNITVSARAEATTGESLRDMTDEAADKVGDAASRAGETITDAAITTAVKAKLLADPNVSGLKIDVDTADGIVTLTGTVNSAAEREIAVRLARSTDGVKRVESRLMGG